MSHHLDLHEHKHSECHSCSRAERAEIDDDGLCSRTKSDHDQLSVRCVGKWAYEKIYRLERYFGIFANGMKNQWLGLNYVEICSGPGRCITREDRMELDGTALAVIHNKHFRVLKKALFIDASPRVAEILNQRIKARDANDIAEAAVGNYEDAPGLCRVLDRLPGSCLNLVFIDPTECDVPFTTIKRIVDHLQNADLLINVALGTDVTRNIVKAILSPKTTPAREKYERFLGIPGFCARPDVIELAKRADHDDLRRVFVESYKEQLQKLGYNYTNIRPVRHYYHLLFAARKPKGLEFWMKSCEIAPDNQRELL